MNREKYVLTALGVGVVVWSTLMIVSVFCLAGVQGPSALWALLEVATFVGAGLLPLLLIWGTGARYRNVLIGVWVVCLAYVTVLALNALRLGLFTMGSVRLALWIAIAVLLVRALRTPSRLAVS